MTALEPVSHCTSGWRWALGLLCLHGLLASCAGVSTSVAMPPPRDVSTPPTLPPAHDAGARIAPPPLATATTDAEFMQLRRALVRQVPRTIVSLPPGRMNDFVARSRAALDADGIRLQTPGLLVVVDRNPATQLLVIIIALSDRNWQLV